MIKEASHLEWGSKEWKTHLRRSLAQRKRHGESITDIEGLISYIERKGPAKSQRKPQKKGASANGKKIYFGSSQIVRPAEQRVVRTL